MPTFAHQASSRSSTPAGVESGPTARHAARQFSPLLLWSPRPSNRLPLLLRSGRVETVEVDAAAPCDVDALMAAVVRERDRSAFARLFDFYSPRLQGHLLARGTTPANAEEIVQEVMLTVWRKAEQFDPRRGSAGAWIFTLARNAFIDRVRHEHRPAIDPSDPLLSATTSGTEQLVMEAESRQELAAALQALPAEQRNVVQRSYFQGQSLAQISAADGLPIGTVKTRARLALSRLRGLVTRWKEP